jgi:hypothetical protein
MNVSNHESRLKILSSPAEVGSDSVKSKVMHLVLTADAKSAQLDIHKNGSVKHVHIVDPTGPACTVELDLGDSVISTEVGLAKIKEAKTVKLAINAPGTPPETVTFWNCLGTPELKCAKTSKKSAPRVEHKLQVQFSAGSSESSSFSADAYSSD